MTAEQSAIQDRIRLIQAGYLEMPGLQLTKPQVRRLWRLEPQCGSSIPWRTSAVRESLIVGAEYPAELWGHVGAPVTECRPFASPQHLASRLHPHRPAGMRHESEPLRVLVVDDEPLMRWSVAETLSGRGDLVTEAESGEAAIRALADARGGVDVVLLDYHLPDSRDLGLLSTVRRLAPQSAVILMSACCTPEIANDALALGAYRVISKPIDMCELPSLVGAAGAYGASRRLSVSA